MQVPLPLQTRQGEGLLPYPYRPRYPGGMGGIGSAYCGGFPIDEILSKYLQGCQEISNCWLVKIEL